MSVLVTTGPTNTIYGRLSTFSTHILPCNKLTKKYNWKKESVAHVQHAVFVAGAPAKQTRKWDDDVCMWCTDYLLKLKFVTYSWITAPGPVVVYTTLSTYSTLHRTHNFMLNICTAICHSIYVFSRKRQFILK